MRARVASLLVVLVAVSSFSGLAQRTSRRVFVHVADRGGAPILDLTAPEVTLTENGVVREVTRVTRGTEPMRIVLLVDSSSAVNPQITHFRAGLNAFLTALPGGHELVFVTTGGQMRVRVPPTTDRQKVQSAAAGFAPDGGANAFMEATLEADRRFLKSTGGRWPVFAILITDSAQSRQQAPVEAFNDFVNDFIARGGSAHALVLTGTTSGIVSEFARNLTGNVGGQFETLAIANALPDKMKALADRIGADHRAMAARYEVEYTSDAKMAARGIEVSVPRAGAQIRLSARRPF
jgi:von Willebrand factor type A domain